MPPLATEKFMEPPAPSGSISAPRSIRMPGADRGHSSANPQLEARVGKSEMAVVGCPVEENCVDWSGAIPAPIIPMPPPK